MTLTGYENHSYWLYDLYDYYSNGLINLNAMDDYLIMIQILYRENYQITDKITRQKMKDFALPLPKRFDKNNKILAVTRAHKQLGFKWLGVRRSRLQAR